MSTDHDKAECGQFSPREDITGQGTEADKRGISVPECSRDMSLADFARRVRACETYWRLDMLHTLLLRTVPVGKRADYIALLNQREEVLSYQDTEMAWKI